ncbi:MAG TPA: exopolysaccharide biosynthesis polyprenyl glycosylphosphotransferase [Azospirillaceae bacterium]|nr:exopolysaccharide biosynthesis polyprenyl glycosylphosphotransferase [Azospirillaceae bacterium]
MIPDRLVPAQMGTAVRGPRRGVASAVLVIGDLVVLVGSVLAGLLVRLHTRHWLPIDLEPQNFVGVIVAVLFLPFAYAVAQLYPGYGQTGVERLRKRVTATALCFAAMILFDRVAQDGQWSRGILLTAATVAVVTIPIWDGVARRLLLRWGLWGEPVVVLGPLERRDAVVAALAEQPELGWIPVAHGDVPPAPPPRPRNVELALVVPPDRGMALSSLADDLPYRRVVLVPDVAGMQSLWVSVRDLGTHLGLEMRRNLLNPVNQMVKRALDLALGTMALVVAVPVIALFAGLVVIVSPGPALYSQMRVGRGGGPFRIWKLRTMKPGADALLEELITISAEARAEWNRSMKIRNDPRIIPVVGHFMRRFSIDELPQFWNVLRGDMSLVGPRPLPSYHATRLDTMVDRLRGRVRPGITGLWQVSGRSTASLSDQEHLDAYYVRNWSLWLDIHILARTVLVVLGGKGAW